MYWICGHIPKDCAGPRVSECLVLLNTTTPTYFRDFKTVSYITDSRYYSFSLLRSCRASEVCLAHCQVFSLFSVLFCCKSQKVGVSPPNTHVSVESFRSSFKTSHITRRTAENDVVVGHYDRAHSRIVCTRDVQIPALLVQDNRRHFFFG